jgi:hypothetical protein
MPMLSFPGSGVFNKFGRWLYRVTQLRVHVIVTHAFLKSLGNLRLERSRIGKLREPGGASAQPLAHEGTELLPIVSGEDAADGP